MNIFIFPLANAPIINSEYKKTPAIPPASDFLHIGQDTLIARNISCSN